MRSSLLAYLSSTLLNEVGLSLFRYFGVGLRVCDIVVNKFTFAISSPDEFLYYFSHVQLRSVNSIHQTACITVQCHNSNRVFTISQKYISSVHQITTSGGKFNIL